MLCESLFWRAAVWNHYAPKGRCSQSMHDNDWSVQWQLMQYRWLLALVANIFANLLRQVSTIVSHGPIFNIFWRFYLIGEGFCKQNDNAQIKLSWTKILPVACWRLKSTHVITLFRQTDKSSWFYGLYNIDFFCRSLDLCNTACPPKPVDVCKLPKVVGPCRARFPRYFYNSATGDCEKFFYGGCRGNANNFM